MSKLEALKSHNTDVKIVQMQQKEKEEAPVWAGAAGALDKKRRQHDETIHAIYWCHAATLIILADTTLAVKLIISNHNP